MALKEGVFDQPGTLMTRTLELFKERNTLDVYEATRLPWYWLNQFKSGKVKNPSVNRVQFLFEYLSGEKINAR